MTDIFILLGLVLGMILLIFGKKKQNYKVLKLIGILLILVSLAVAAPDFIRGFRDGL